MGKVLLFKISLADIQSSGLFSPYLDPVSNKTTVKRHGSSLNMDRPQMILRTVIHFVECDHGLVVTSKKQSLPEMQMELFSGEMT